MKLLYCEKCQDVVRLIEKERTCRCGLSGGRYIDDLNAEYWGDSAYPIGFANTSFLAAKNAIKACRVVKDERLKALIHDEDRVFIAFTIPDVCETMKKVRKPRKDRKNS